MRILFAALLSILVLWAGFWVVGQRFVKGQIATVLGADFPEGITLTHAGFDLDGFPSRFDLTLNQPQIRDATMGWAWSADFVQVFAMTWKPWHLIAALPDQQTIGTPNGPVALSVDRMVGSLRVTPSADAALQEAVVEVETARLNATFLPDILLDRLVVALRAESGGPVRYRFGVTLTHLEPLVENPTGAALILGTIDLNFDLDAPLNRFAGQSAPEVTGLDLQSLDLDWGDVRLTGSGTLRPDANGQANGEIMVKIAGWQSLPLRLADFALVQPEFVPSLTRGLQIIAGEQGNPSVLDLPLTLSDGWMTLGGLPLGPAPMMGQRQ